MCTANNGFFCLISVSEIEKVQDAFIVAVEDDAQQKLENAATLQNVVPRDMIKLSSQSPSKTAEKSPQHSDISVEDTPTNTISMPIGKSPKKKANGHANNGEMNGNTQYIEMNGYLENDTPKKGKGKSKKDGKRQKVERNSETPLIEDVDAQSRQAPNGHPLGQSLQNRSRENVTDSEMEHSSFEFEDPGPHREMAVDCPDGFVATVKGPPRYPPSQAHTPRGPAPQTTPVKNVNSSRDYGESDSSFAMGTGSFGNSQVPPTMEQLERLRHHQEELRRRREEEAKHSEEDEFLRTSIRGSKKLQALEANKKVLPTGICNTGFMDGEEDDLYDGLSGAPPPPLTGKENYMKKNIGECSSILCIKQTEHVQSCCSSKTRKIAPYLNDFVLLGWFWNCT